MASQQQQQQQRPASSHTPELGDSQRDAEQAAAGERNRLHQRHRVELASAELDSSQDAHSPKVCASPVMNRKRKQQLTDKDQSDLESETDEQVSGERADEERVLRMVASQQQQMSLLRKRRLSSGLPTSKRPALADADIGEQISVKEERVCAAVSSSELGGPKLELQIEQQIQLQRQRKQLRRADARALSPACDNGDESGAPARSSPSSSTSASSTSDELERYDELEQPDDSDHENHQEVDRDHQRDHDRQSNHSDADSDDPASLGSGKRSPTRQAH